MDRNLYDNDELNNIVENYMNHIKDINNNIISMSAHFSLSVNEVKRLIEESNILCSKLNELLEAGNCEFKFSLSSITFENDLAFIHRYVSNNEIAKKDEIIGIISQLLVNHGFIKEYSAKVDYISYEAAKFHVEEADTKDELVI